VSVEFCGLELAAPVINGSGTFDAIAARRVFGDSLTDAFPFAAYVSKTITLQPRAGNPPPRLWETSSGLINSIGLPNKGLHRYIEEDLPQIVGLRTRIGGEDERQAQPVPVITNVMGSTAAELSALVEACDARPEIAAIELNVSCPNVHTGLDIGADPRQLEAVVAEVRGHSAKPLIVKLTPNTADVALCALAAQEAGADAVSLINTLRAMALAPRSRSGVGGAAAAAASSKPWLGGRTGGLSGPAIRAVALAQVAAVAARVTIPVVGMGGVQNGVHAQELLDVGAALVGVGTESFRDPAAGARIARELHARCAASSAR
jgi:dihydroorotate dehydrogenase (NAD+) catalytic subunit